MATPAPTGTPGSTTGTTEVERRFLLDRVPGAAELGRPLDGGEPLRQGYLADEGDVSVRVRITDRAATLTVKAGSGLSRTEVELPLSLAEAGALWPHTGDRQIVKRRHRVPLGGDLVAELDVYAGALEGLASVEVEFASEADAHRFAPPAWFGREVTDRPEWTNAALARHGLPPG